MRALFGVVLLGFTALAAGVAGFQAGIASNIGAAGGAVYLGGGIPGLGFLFLFLFLGFLFFALAGRRRRGPWGMAGGHGGPGWGHGPWGMHGGPTGDGDPRRAWIAEAHRRLHEEEARNAGSAGTSGTAGSNPGDSPTGQSAG
jgi:hypothetical protein